MRDKSIIKQKRLRVLYYSTLLLGIFMGVLVTGFLAGNQYLKNNHQKIETKIRAALGFPIIFEDLSFDWHGLSLGIALTHVLVNDAEVPVPFLEMGMIKLLPSLKALILEQKLRFRKIQIQDLNMVVAYGEKKGISLLGLKGESIPTLLDYTSFINFIRQQDGIEIERLNIEWRLGDFHFKQLSSNLNVAVSPKIEKISIDINNANHSAHCDFVKMMKDWQVGCEVGVQQFEIAKIGEFYQAESGSPEWLDWLKNALKTGKMTEGILKIGYLDGKLDWNGHVEYEDVGIVYAKGWPMITDASGKVQFDQKNVSIQASQGQILDAHIGPVSVLIGRLDKPEPVVQIQGSAESTLETGTLFLKKSPLHNSIAKWLGPLALKGPMDLDLKLIIPLTGKTPIKVDGLLSTKEGQLTIPETNLSLSSLQGKFHFTENVLEGMNVSANLFDQNFDIILNTHKILQKNYLQVSATGVLNAGFFQKEFSFPLLKKLQGSSIFSLAIQVPLETLENQKEKIEWRLSSNLQGMAIQLPGFMAKKAEDKRVFTFGMELGQERKRVNIHAEKLMDAKIIIGAKPGTNEGNIVFGSGVANWPSVKGLSIQGEISAVNVEDWLDFFDSSSPASRWFSSVDLRLLINQLQYRGLSLEKTWVSTQFSENPLEWQFGGDSMKGKIGFEKNNQNKIVVDLDYFRFASAKKIIEKAFPLQDFKKELSFYCKEVQYDQKNFGEVSFQLIPKIFGFDIKELVIDNKNAELFATGEWYLSKSGSSHTTLKGTLRSRNVGDTLQGLGYSTAIRDAAGKVDYQLKWNGDPFQVKLETLEGEVDIRFDKGRILGLNPGLGRIVGLLSLENIQRRLRLDFSDLLKKGFAFDSLKGKFKFTTGFVHSDSLNIESPSAKIEMSGQANLASKEIHLNMAVTRRLSSAGFPVAAAIAAGPVAGAGVFIIDWLTGSKIDKINRHRYEVTGTWDAPRIQEALKNS